MDKILVEVRVPAADMSVDAYFPLESKLWEVLSLLVSAVNELSAGKYRAAPDAVLCDAGSGIIYNINLEVAELGLQNGSKLLLI